MAQIQVASDWEGPDRHHSDATSQVVHSTNFVGKTHIVANTIDLSHLLAVSRVHILLSVFLYSIRSWSPVTLQYYRGLRLESHWS